MYNGPIATFKIAVNMCYGGFSLSEAAINELKSMGVKLHHEYGDCGLDRANPELIRVIEKLGERASDILSNIRIVEAYVVIQDNDGYENKVHGSSVFTKYRGGQHAIHRDTVGI